MSGEDGAERSHEATPQKLERARQKGEIVKSQDLATWGGYLGALLGMTLLAPFVGAQLRDLGGTLLEQSDLLAAPLRSGGSGPTGPILARSLSAVGLLVLPMAGLVIAVLVAQRAIVVAPSKLAPKLSRISLVSNAKNKFGPSGLFEFAKSAVKMIAFCILLAWFLVGHADRMVAAAAGDPRAIVGTMAGMLTEFAVAVVLLSGAVAAIDYAWQRHAHLSKNRMTRQEVLDEMKQSDGDPHMKGKRREKAQEIALNKMIHDVPDATVVLVNPTHYAVALKWSPSDPTPPVCLAKGVDNMAHRIREAATEAGVPIYSDPPAARALHATVEVGDPIAREHFAAVAAAVRFARSLTGEDAP
ncbi:flagellar type III secretion system protein FlhB [Jannaschia sp. S6380]|uniref:EscU/YscU/HrcU family type III secretion system export apparatus switch protein n=1 Tax=Jannaschia sp. S6380 TaxID=2926408 RepID=UPI001FF1BA30|nr:flagellar type III secretion system protein FlhB [Jannaschia sp. S6380]MCK0168255.1 flagellar type III secretion system protein FlhB [Jannaschia sp. S6380]